jgi:hypothetical protein
MLTNFNDHGVNKSQLMSRAWQLARLNRRAVTVSLKINFGRWLSAAWAEAKEGRTEFWAMNDSPKARLQLEIDCLKAKDHWTLTDYQVADTLERQLRQVWL